jgi:hypothetical protein
MRLERILLFESIHFWQTGISYFGLLIVKCLHNSGKDITLNKNCVRLMFPKVPNFVVYYH